MGVQNRRIGIDATHECTSKDSDTGAGAAKPEVTLELMPISKSNQRPVIDSQSRAADCGASIWVFKCSLAFTGTQTKCHLFKDGKYFYGKHADAAGVRCGATVRMQPASAMSWTPDTALIYTDR
ncbi:hypothetical protein ACJJTC_012193 [Scirpophaga incertulas]